VTRVITVSGLDGSGKSTQVEMLRAALVAAGENVHDFHAIQFSIAQRLRNAVRRARGKSASPGEGAAVTSAGPVGIAARRAALPIDMWRYRRLLRKLAREGVTTVLTDRYFYDALVNIAFLAKSETPGRARIPRPDHGFYLRVAPAEIVKRDRVPEQGVAYLEQKFALYEQLAEREALVIIDGGRAAEQVAADLAAAVGDEPPPRTRAV